MTSSLRLSAPAALSAVLLMGATARPAAAESVNFDNVVASPSGTQFAGNTWAGKGVLFSSVNSTNAVSVGQTITISSAAPRVMVLANNDSVSAPNFAAASGVFNTTGPNDVLMRFASPVDSIRLVTDQSVGETPDLVRLIALAPAGPNTFVVTAINTGLDNAMTSPANVLAVAPPNPVSFALFQVTTEAEGFDNLIYTHPPDCTKVGIGAIVRGCYQHPPVVDWVPTGCEVVDCCPLCPGPLDWFFEVDGDPFDRVLMHFEGLTPEVAQRLTVEGNAVWDAERQVLEIDGPGKLTVRGFALDADPRWTAASPRMTLQTVEAPASREGTARALRVSVTQKVGGDEISHSSLVYGF